MFNQFVINGGKKIQGEISVSGAKNFALKALAAVLLTEEKSVIQNLPQIVDVPIMINLLGQLGVVVKKKGNKSWIFDPINLNKSELDPKEVGKVRASIVFTGPLLVRTKKVAIAHPGGDIIGKRPIDFFLEGFQKMGAKIENKDDFYYIKAKNGLHGAEIFFPKISVTGTETLVMAAVLAQGKTILKNTAIEPEVISLLECLKQMGAKIEGVGTPTLVINGVKKLRGGDFKIIPDRLETGTFVMMGLMNKAEVLVKDCEPQHIEALLERLEKAGAKLEIGKNFIRTIPQKTTLNATALQTHEYPGFATDLQPIFTLLMTQAKGVSIIHEPIFEGRLFFTDILSRMGANIIMCDPHRVVVGGPTRLYPRQIESPDIRAGIALLLATILAKGQSVIDNAQIIDRGYENIDGRLRALGVDIRRR